jgi:ATP-dependent DNA helicase DinG
MEASERFTNAARETLRAEIAKAKGNEVFAVCKIDENGMVAEVTIAARGNRGSVPALASYIEKGDVLVHNHPSGFLEPSDADISVAGRMGELGSGSYIVDNQVEEVYVVAEPVTRRHFESINPSQLASILEDDGPLARKLPGYESRPPQIALLKLIARAFNEDSVCAAEAGTGVGKSFAYLIPALWWANKNKERVIVSTATINLQEQLMSKDIPAVNALFKEPVKACLMKGRANYICHTRLHEALEEDSLFAQQDEQSELGRIAAWADTTKNGSKSDLSFMPEESTWSKVCSESDFCLNMKCPYRTKCFVIAMKQEAADSQVLVVNHHLLFADLQARLSGAGWENTAVLPPFNRLVIDEAHNIENNATSYFSFELQRFQIYKQLSRLYRDRGGRRYGAAILLQNLVKKNEKKLFEEIPNKVAGVREAMAAVDVLALSLLESEQTFRVTEESETVRQAILEPLEQLEKRIQVLLAGLQECLDAVPEEKLEEIPAYETKVIMRRLESSALVCSMFKRWEDSPEQVFWLSREKSSSKDPFACFHVTPVNISNTMVEAVYEPCATVVCTSATLTVANRFDYWKSRVGLSFFNDRPLLEGVFPSPFPYKTNVMLAVPTDAPQPDQAGYSEYTIEAAKKILELSGGHGLVLYTSYEAMRQGYESVKPALEAMQIACFRQGEDDRSRLLDRFKTDSSSVLFATDSFWEGVDAPGDTLQVVIIAKLPFKVPTDAVQKARAEAIERGGGNSFMDMSLPTAVMKLKQGFGRLMRRSDDHGIVVILDSRIHTKRYGNIFVQSLPETKRSFKPLSGVLDDMERFMFSR